MDIPCLIRIVRLNRTLRLSLLPVEYILPVATEAVSLHIDEITVRLDTPTDIIAKLSCLYPNISISMVDDDIITPYSCTDDRSCGL